MPQLTKWVEKASFPEKYVVMLEPDHILLQPLPNLMRGERPAAYPFAYMSPNEGSNRELVKRWVRSLGLRSLGVSINGSSA